jgi:AcrR family transcriptional regulator
MSRPRRSRLSADDWIEAALAAIAEGGPGAVAVEPLAVGLGATKGSFYWHFANRDALVAAALERWERSHTEEIIRFVEGEPDPVARLRALFVRVLETVGRDRIGVQLLAAADHPLVSDVVRRVTDRRIGYMVGLFEQLGLGSEEARARAVLVYTAYVGHDQIAFRMPGALPADPGYPDVVAALVLAPLGLPTEPPSRTS